MTAILEVAGTLAFVGIALRLAVLLHIIHTCRQVTGLPLRMLIRGQADRALREWARLVRAGIAPDSAIASYEREVGCLHLRWDNDHLGVIYDAWWEGECARKGRDWSPTEFGE